MTETLFVHTDTVAATPGPTDTTFPAADVQHYGVKIAWFGDDDNANYVVALTHDLRRAIAAANRWWRDRTGEHARTISVETAIWWSISPDCASCATDQEHSCTWWAHLGDFTEQHAWRYEPCTPEADGAWPVIELAVR